MHFMEPAKALWNGQEPQRIMDNRFLSLGSYLSARLWHLSRSAGDIDYRLLKWKLGSCQHPRKKTSSCFLSKWVVQLRRFVCRILSKWKCSTMPRCPVSESFWSPHGKNSGNATRQWMPTSDFSMKSFAKESHADSILIWNSPFLSIRMWIRKTLWTPLKTSVSSKSEAPWIWIVRNQK